MRHTSTPEPSAAAPYGWITASCGPVDAKKPRSAARNPWAFLRSMTAKSPPNNPNDDDDDDDDEERKKGV